MRRILLLGAAPAQIPALRAALDAGCEVHTADNRPENPGHRLAHVCHHVDASDASAVAALARELRVDGVAGFSSEVCARTAARVAAALGLPGSPLAGVENLSDKARFRACQRRAGLVAPAWREFAENDLAAGLDFIDSLGRERVVVKAVDNSGGRGVSIRPADPALALPAAFRASFSRRALVEEFVDRSGSQCGGDGWMRGGELVFLHPFDNRTLPPPADAVAIEETFPSRRSDPEIARLRQALAAAMRAAGYTDGPFNFDACFREDGRPFLFEIAPRNAGNSIPEVIARRTGVDLAAAVVAFALGGEPVLEQGLDEGQLGLPNSGRREARPPLGACHAIRILAAPADGILRSIDLAAEVEKWLWKRTDYVQPGAPVRAYRTAGEALGTLLFEFPDRATMDSVLPCLASGITVRLEDS